MTTEANHTTPDEANDHASARAPRHPTPPAEPKRREWALYAYIAGDNDLSEAGLSDIQEMCDAGASSRVWAAVEIDTIGDWDGSIRYQISDRQWDGQSYRIVIERLYERDSGSPYTLHDFVSWADERYPANHRLLVVWGHGAGFFKRGSRAIAYDDNGGAMTIPQLARAIRSARAELQQLAVLGFDACTMAMVEVAHELAGLADILVSSQALVPGDGWRYDQVLWDMDGEHGTPTPSELATSIVDRFVDNYRRGPEVATQSAVRLASVEAAHTALHELGDALLSLLKTRRSEILLARDMAQTFEEFYDYIDAVDLCDKLMTLQDDQVNTAAATLRARVEDAVIHNGHHGDEVARAHGLSIWFPRSPCSYFSERGEYVRLRGSAPDRGWVRWLDALHG